MRFNTEFTTGPDGYLLQSIKTGDTTETAVNGDASFAFTYQTVQGFELPSLVTIRPSTTEPWHYALTDCKTVTGATIKLGPPKSGPAQP
jgi:hypothetical protein